MKWFKILPAGQAERLGDPASALEAAEKPEPVFMSTKGALCAECQAAAWPNVFLALIQVHRKLERYEHAVNYLYHAAYWHADRPVDEARLWEELRAAGEFPEGRKAQILACEEGYRRR